VVGSSAERGERADLANNGFDECNGFVSVIEHWALFDVEFEIAEARRSEFRIGNACGVEAEIAEGRSDQVDCSLVERTNQGATADEWKIEANTLFFGESNHFDIKGKRAMEVFNHSYGEDDA